MSLVTAWSASRLTDYEMCPGITRYKVVERISEGPPHPAGVHGLAVHKQAEDYLAGRARKVPEAFGYLEDHLKALKKAKAVPEMRVALDATWTPLPDFFHPDTWVRMVLDAAVIRKVSARVVDYKTGKEKPEHEEQLELYALALWACEPKVRVVTGELWYTPTGRRIELTFERDEEMALRARWAERARKLTSDTVLAPKACVACRWCAFSRQKGGPCPEG